MEDGNIIVKDHSPLKVEIEGTQGTVVSKIPEYFFEGMESLTPGKALGIAIIKSASGGKSEVNSFSVVNKLSVYLTFQLISCLCGATKRLDFMPTSISSFNFCRPPPQDLLHHPYRNRPPHHFLRILHIILP